MNPVAVLLGLWSLWAFSWLVAALWSNRTQDRPALSEQFRYRLPLIAGFVLMFGTARGYEGPLRFWHLAPALLWTCTAAVATGMALAWWARLTLGRLWSGQVTRKEGHRVIDTGPYAHVRHPIYTGLLVALLATALAGGSLFSLGGFALLALGIWLKARLEERWLAAQFPDGSYAAYMQRVPMLLPRR